MIDCRKSKLLKNFSSKRLQNQIFQLEIKYAIITFNITMYNLVVLSNFVAIINNISKQKICKILLLSLSFFFVISFAFLFLFLLCFV